MIKFAKLSEDNKVESVILLDNQYDNNAQEVGKLLSGTFVQITDPSGAFKGNVTKQPQLDAEYVANQYFVDPKPFPSWVFNLSTYQWEAPVAQVNETDVWIEEDLSWYPLSASYEAVQPTATFTPSAVTLDSLNTRLSALEADEVSDDATSSALLTLIAGLAARITVLEGGN